MAWYHIFSLRPTTAQLVKLAHTLARTHQQKVLAATRGQAVPMSRAESRGYVRVKAAVMMRAEVRRMIGANRDLGDWAFDTLVQHSVEALVNLVAADLQRLRVAVPVQTRRRAA